jgi:hypothetical protein
VSFVVTVDVVLLMVTCILLDQRKLAQRSERVKSVDLHPTEPWYICWCLLCWLIAAIIYCA